MLRVRSVSPPILGSWFQFILMPFFFFYGKTQHTRLCQHYTWLSLCGTTTMPYSSNATMLFTSGPAFYTFPTLPSHGSPRHRFCGHTLLLILPPSLLLRRHGPYVRTLPSDISNWMPRGCGTHRIYTDTLPVCAPWFTVCYFRSTSHYLADTRAVTHCARLLRLPRRCTRTHTYVPLRAWFILPLVAHLCFRLRFAAAFTHTRVGRTFKPRFRWLFAARINIAHTPLTIHCRLTRRGAAPLRGYMYWISRSVARNATPRGLFSPPFTSSRMSRQHLRAALTAATRTFAFWLVRYSCLPLTYSLPGAG